METDSHMAGPSASIQCHPPHTLWVGGEHRPRRLQLHRAISTVYLASYDNAARHSAIDKPQWRNPQSPNCFFSKMTHSGINEFGERVVASSSVETTKCVRGRCRWKLGQ